MIPLRLEASFGGSLISCGSLAAEVIADIESTRCILKHGQCQFPRLSVLPFFALSPGSLPILGALSQPLSTVDRGLTSLAGMPCQPLTFVAHPHALPAAFLMGSLSPELLKESCFSNSQAEVGEVLFKKEIWHTPRTGVTDSVRFHAWTVCVVGRSPPSPVLPIHEHSIDLKFFLTQICNFPWTHSPVPSTPRDSSHISLCISFKAVIAT